MEKKKILSVLFFTFSTLLFASSVLADTTLHEFVFTVQRATDDPLTGVKCYVFNQAGRYLGSSASTDSGGRVSFSLADGSYRLRVDYLGYQFWSDLYEVPATLFEEINIPHQDVVVTVQGVGEESLPLPGLKVYLFTAAGGYQGQSRTTDDNGQASFYLPAQPYKVRVDYLGKQFWSETFVSKDVIVNIPMAETEVAVTGAGVPVPGVKVYVFSAAGSYLGISGTTNADGKVPFTLAEGGYKFRVDYQGSQYWSAEETLTTGQVNAVSISTGGGTFTLHVMKGPADPLAGVKCYVFSQTGSYLGLSASADSNGTASFNLADGAYKLRVDYLGYQFWSDPYDVPTILSAQMSIPHQDVVVTVQGMGQEFLPLPGLKVYLFTAAGAYQGQSRTTDGNGQANFNLPGELYKVRIDYLGKQFWSEAFVSEDITVDIPMADTKIAVTGAGVPLSGVKVYVFSISGAYLGISGTTDANGKVSFTLSEGEYKFRVDYQGSQYWSAEKNLAEGEANPVTVSTGGGTFTLQAMKGPADPLAGVKCYVFSQTGSYLGLSASTDSNGMASFNLADGTYEFMVDYLGYQFWSELYVVPTTLSAEMSIPHQDVMVRVEGLNKGAPEPMQGLRVYLFTASGAYQGQSRVTNANGEATFNLPEQSYKVRVDYLDQQLWSETFVSEDIIVNIPMAETEIAVAGASVPLSGVKVYVFSTSGAYLGISGTTDANGKVSFTLSEGEYKFRVDYQGSQYWSDAQNLSTGQLNLVNIGTVPARIQVPDVVGHSLPDAESAINGAGLTIGTTTQQYNDTVPEGLVITQNPAAGVPVEEGSQVDVVVSLGPAPITSVTITASPQVILEGDSSTLRWNSTNADSCSIEPDIGSVDLNGSLAVTPTETTTYTIRAAGSGGTAAANVTITVDHIAPSPTEQKLTASSCEPYGEFGRAVAIRGDYAIVGAPYHNIGGDGGYTGAAFVFHRVGSSWVELMRLAASDAQEGEEFGMSVSMNADYAVVGAPYHNIGGDGGCRGAAFVFNRADSSWNEVSKLAASDGQEFDEFGSSVAIEGDYVIVGAPYHNSIAGAAYVFKREGSAWVEQVKLSPSDPASDDRFGYSVAISGEYAIVGAIFKAIGESGYDRMLYAGVAYIFKRDGSTWTEQAKLIPGDAKSNSSFGASVCISGDDTIIGAPFHDVEGIGGYTYEGAAYIFKREDPVWVQQASVFASDVQEYANFGTFVSMSGDYAIVGAPREDVSGTGGTDNGAAYVFRREGLSWSQVARLSPADGRECDEFGSSVATDGDYVIVGAPYCDASGESGSDEGAAYIYPLENLIQNPSVSVSADPKTILIGESSTLSWISTNAESCVIEPDIGTVVLTGSIIVSPNETTSYTIRATGPQGMVTSTVTVTVNIPLPVVDIHASPAIISVGESSTLTWTSENTESVTIDQGIGPVPANGSTTVFPSETTIYAVTASGPYGIGTASVTVTVDCNPEIMVIEPARGDNLVDTAFRIKWTDNDPDSNANVRLYYDTDNSGADGILIVAGLSEDMDGSGDEYLWDTSGVPEGIYYVYAMIDDGVRQPVVAYSPGVVSIDRTPPFITELKLNPHDAAEGDMFGESVSIDGDYLIVGANGSGQSGAAYIYEREGTVWAEQAKLVPNDGGVGDSFGSFVAIRGDYAFVTAPYNGHGAIYIFKHEGSNWNQETKLSISSDLGQILDGMKVAGDYIAVSAWSFYPDRVCRIGIFNRSGTTWTRQTVLQTTDPDIYFGGNFIIDGDYLLAGITQQFYWGRDFVGVEVFKRDGESWVKQGTLIHSDFSIYDEFGASIAIYGNGALIGAPGSRPGGYYYSGAVYVFRREGGTWYQEAKLLPDDLTKDLGFGGGIAVDGDLAIITIGSEVQGYSLCALEIYKHMGASWVRQGEIKTRDANTYSNFASSFAISGDYAIIGAPYDTDHGDYSGSAFVYHIIAIDISSSSNKILAGGSTSLSWNCVNATSVSIDQGIGTVPIQGSLTVSPTETTTYTITATFPWGTYTDSVTVTVVPLTISISSPIDSATIVKPEVTVEGTISDVPGFEIGVNVNGVVAMVDGDHFVASHVALEQGANTIIATAVDTFGHTASASVTVSAETSGEYVRISADPESGISPLESTLRIEASFTFDNSSVTYTGPGAVQFISNPDPTEYHVRITTPGLYAFTVEVTDAGKQCVHGDC